MVPMVLLIDVGPRVLVTQALEIPPLASVTPPLRVRHPPEEDPEFQVRTPKAAMVQTKAAMRSHVAQSPRQSEAAMPEVTNTSDLLQLLQEHHGQEPIDDCDF